ncbi:MAG: tyrosine-type recombinase/integrase [Bacteriovoracaceae bacterium]
MNDDIFERFIKSIGIVLGGFLLLYCLIVTTQKHPRGIALKIVVLTEFVAKGLFYIGLGLGVISLLTILIENRIRKKRIKKEEQAHIELKQFPKYREPRAVFITNEIMAVLRRREAFRIPGNDYVFHVEGNPLNYCTIQINNRGAQMKRGIPYTGNHILRHGMAKLARQIGGDLDVVLAMTGHKDLKLADHYSKSNEDDQKHFSEMIMKHIRKQKAEDQRPQSGFENVIRLKNFITG